MKVKIEKLSHDFKGIGRINNKVVFIPNTLPLEVVDAHTLKSKKRADYAEVRSILEESADRTEPKCPYYLECGGCQTSYVKYAKCLSYKREIFRDIMKRYANMEVYPEIISDNKEYGYRDKITLRILNGSLALVKEETNILCNISSCLLVNDKINEVIKKLNTISLDGIQKVTIKGHDEIMVIVEGKYDKKELITLLKGDVHSIILNDKVIYGIEYIKIKVKNFIYAIYPKSFFQVNTGMTEKLYDKVLEYAGKGEVLTDLYCGAGTIGIFLSSNYKRVIGIEVNDDAIKGANLNKEINNILNISFECKKVSEIKVIEGDTVVVDPPRAGLDKITIEKLLTSDIKRLVYVSCNPLTFARDVNLLKDKYAVEDITLFDMFPNTKHMESVSLLVRKN